MAEYARKLVQRFGHEALLMAIVLAVFWPLVTGVTVPKWDSLDGYLPYRYIVSDFIGNGELPYWHPYTHLGNPTYADLQSGAWAPYVWLISVFGTYGVGALVGELLLCFIIAALGMFYLLVHVTRNRRMALIFGLSYSLSGFMVGSAHLMVFLLGLAWLPWIVLFLLKTLRAPTLRHAVALGMVVALHTSAASPAFTIMLAYFLVAVMVWYYALHQGPSLPSKRVLSALATSAATSVLLLLPFITSFAEFAPYFNRIERMALKQFLINPFTPKEYISFVFPYTTVANTTIFSETDLTLRNGYFGLLGLFGLFAGAFTLPKKYWVPVWVGGALALLCAAGAHTGAYHVLIHLPGIGLFRHPSIYKTYLIFPGLVLAAMAFSQLDAEGRLRKVLFRLGMAMMVAGVIAFMTGITFSSVDELTETLRNVWHTVEFSSAGAMAHLAINALVILMVGVLLMVAGQSSAPKARLLLTVAVVFEFVAVSWLIAPTTVYNKLPRSEMAAFIDRLPAEPDQRFNDVPMRLLQENEGMEKTPGLWRNMSVFHKRPAYNGCNPLRFKAFDDLLNAGEADRVLDHPLFRIEHSLGANEARLVSTIIVRNGFNAVVTNPGEAPVTLVINQNYHHLWRAYVNGVETPVFLVNKAVFGAEIPALSHAEVTFTYRSAITPIAAILAVVGWVLAVVLLFMTPFKRTETT